MISSHVTRHMSLASRAHLIPHSKRNYLLLTVSEMIQSGSASATYSHKDQE
jgi:hypothetical protein